MDCLCSAAGRSHNSAVPRLPDIGSRVETKATLTWIVKICQDVKWCQGCERQVLCREFGCLHHSFPCFSYARYGESSKIRGRHRLDNLIHYFANQYHRIGDPLAKQCMARSDVNIHLLGAAGSNTTRTAHNSIWVLCRLRSESAMWTLHMAERLLQSFWTFASNSRSCSKLTASVSGPMLGEKTWIMPTKSKKLGEESGSCSAGTHQVWLALSQLGGASQQNHWESVNINMNISRIHIYMVENTNSANQWALLLINLKKQTNEPSYKSSFELRTSLEGCISKGLSFDGEKNSRKCWSNLLSSSLQMRRDRWGPEAAANRPRLSEASLHSPGHVGAKFVTLSRKSSIHTGKPRNSYGWYGAPHSVFSKGNHVLHSCTSRL